MGFFDKFRKQKQPVVATTKSNTCSEETYTYEEVLKIAESEGDYAAYRKMLILACRQNEVRASIWLAVYSEHRGEFVKAAEWYKRAYDAGVEGAKAEYERCSAPHYYNPSVYNPYDIAPRKPSPNGTRGCGTAYYKYVYEEECKQKRDYAAAIAQLEQETTRDQTLECFKTIHLIALAQGCAVPEAQIWMGNYCETVGEDFKEAAQWFKKASDLGSAEGSRCYADMLISGRGVAQNIEEAMKYYRLAAEKGHAEAQFVVAQHCLKQGHREEALRFFKLSAENGYTPAEEQLAQMGVGRAKEIASRYAKKLQENFANVVRKYNLDNNGVLEFFEEIYQPESFCRQAYEYCNDHYEGCEQEKVLFGYCMTPFYGIICATALWKDAPSLYPHKAEVWGVLSQHINVEFTDANAERMLKTKQGEEKAERIYAIISEYMKVATTIMRLNDAKEEVCLKVMKFAYQLGMLVAKNELNLSSDNYVREHIVIDEKGKNDSKEEKHLSVPEFYSQCIQHFHSEAEKNGFAQRGLIFIPELVPLGEKAILAYLQDDFFAQAFGQNPSQYYYVIMSLALQTGICFGARWHLKFDSLNEYVERVIVDGPADDATLILSEIVGIDGNDEQNDFYQKIYKKWVQCHEPYWTLEDPRDYTFKALIAAFQLGVSMILEKYGF